MIHFEKNPTDKTGFCELKLSFDKNEMLRNLEYCGLWTLFHFVKHRTGSKMMCHSVVYTLGIYECPHNLRAGSTDDKMSSKSIWCAAHPLVRSVRCLRLSGSYVGQLPTSNFIASPPPLSPPSSYVGF